MELVDEIERLLEQWEEAAKKKLGISEVLTEDQEIDVADLVRLHHENDIKTTIDRIDAALATLESQLDDELLSQEEREAIEKLQDRLEALKDRLYAIL
jgi:predicted lipoprotein